jgi:hypothetical protein
MAWCRPNSPANGEQQMDQVESATILALPGVGADETDDQSTPEAAISGAALGLRQRAYEPKESRSN